MDEYIEDPDDPDHVIARDEVDAIARLQAERAIEQRPIDAGRRDELTRLEADAPDLSPPAPERKRAGAPFVLALYAMGMPFALLVRLVTSPWRTELRRRARRLEDRRRKDAIDEALSLASAADHEPTNIEARLQSGLAWLSIGQALRAELAFDACVSVLDARQAKNQLAVALQNRSVARSRLGCPKLAAADIRARFELIGPLRGGLRVTMIESYRLLRVGLTLLAGLDAD